MNTHNQHQPGRERNLPLTPEQNEMLSDAGVSSDDASSATMTKAAPPLADAPASAESSTQTPSANPPTKKHKRKKGGANVRGDEEEKPKIAALLLSLVADCTFAHDADDTPLAIVRTRGCRELHKLKSKRFAAILRCRYCERTGSAPPEQAFADAMRTLEAKALMGDCITTWLRVAECDGALYLDLCNDGWSAVRIIADGWEIVNEPPVYFIRNRGMAALPEPQRNGRFDELWRFLNVTEDHRPLVAGWLVNSFRASGALPHLAFTGEQGSAKSTSARVLRSLVDPSTVPLRSPPRDEGELHVSACASWIVCLDNLSGLQPWLSDALCRLATGGGLAKRALYTDTDQILADLRRPAIINGIEDVCTRPDLAERAFAVELQPIAEEDRRAEDEFWNDFKATHPRLLGAILDALSAALRNRGAVAQELVRRPRMADAAIWAIAAEQALGFAPGAFMAALRQNHDESATLAVEHSPVALAIRKLVSASTQWVGTPTELLRELEKLTDDAERRSEAWPKGAAALSQKLKRIAPALRKIGINATQEREGGRKRARRWIIAANGEHD